MIEGHLNNPNPSSKILLIRKVGETVKVDSANVQNGKFHFEGEADYPFPAQLILSQGNESMPSDQVTVYIEPGVVKIEGEDKVSNAKVSGSRTNDLNLEFQNRMTGIRQKGESIQRTFADASSEQKNSKAFIDSLDREYANVIQEYNNMALSFIAEHPDEILSAYMLRSELRMHPDNRAAHSAFTGLSESVKNTPVGKDIGEIINKSRRVEIGKDAPDFSIKDMNGDIINLSDFRGKYVLLNFWSPDCGNCKEEIPILKENYNKYKDKGFVIVSIAVEDESNKQKWLDAIKEYSLDWINASDLKMWQSPILELYNIKAVPHNLIINPSGKIVAKELHGDNLKQALERIL
ncbi:MAG: TlpA disulfide reductase family protein [Dysgonomonas sp.]|nr:TlpA disulfide reductase family protein [Dysgonomonas sp.]